MTGKSWDELKERYDLAISRISQIPSEKLVREPEDAFFKEYALWILEMDKVRGLLHSGEYRTLPLEELSKINRKLYEKVLEENYPESYANPAYACAVLGKDMGQCITFLADCLQGIPAYIFDDFAEAVTVLLELFLEIYNAFLQDKKIRAKAVKDILYWFESDYSDILVRERIRSAVDPEPSPAVRIIKEADLDDPRYLYFYGEYVGENELRMQEYMKTLDEETIGRMADTFSEGYRMGFVHAKKDLSRKITVNVRYQLGFERMIRRSLDNFAKMGLRPVIYRSARNAINRRGANRIGYTGTDPNPQYTYDHREDLALILDKKLSERKLGVSRSTYEDYKEYAAGHAGPAVLEVFGETPFTPASCPHALTFSPAQQKLSSSMAAELARLTNTYIIGEERSFTIIAFPLPSIGDDFEAIFNETIRINTLDSQRYEKVQQAMIDVLDKGRFVVVKGKDGNRTDLRVALTHLDDPQHQTLFENCLADVNIPLGEVFTTPQLEGTNGTLHVRSVYLNGLLFKDLWLVFTDGRVTDYGCANFEKEEENRAYIEENILFHHPALPMGECAIGTNTTAYAMAKRYRIEGLMPILIAEKTGPHFAVGDTCYSFEEDNPVYNPDGKEIIARDNSCSILRKTEPKDAYFGCHTDITIPYEELGLLACEMEGAQGGEAAGADTTGAAAVEEEMASRSSRGPVENCAGESETAEKVLVPIIKDGRFVLPGTELLNEALDSDFESLLG